MLEFKLELSKEKIDPKETARVRFILRNTSDKLIHCLSYKFKTFWTDKLVDNFAPHEFFFSLKPGEEKTQEFGDVNISETYLATNTAPGDYEFKVWIRYFFCGEEEVQMAVSKTVISLIGEPQEE